jgi:outer membrane murein-binding lipoprotein Lpp
VSGSSPPPLACRRRCTDLAGRTSRDHHGMRTRRSAIAMRECPHRAWRSSATTVRNSLHGGPAGGRPGRPWPQIRRADRCASSGQGRRPARDQCRAPNRTAVSRLPDPRRTETRARLARTSLASPAGRPPAAHDREPGRALPGELCDRRAPLPAAVDRGRRRAGARQLAPATLAVVSRPTAGAEVAPPTSSGRRGSPSTDRRVDGRRMATPVAQPAAPPVGWVVVSRCWAVRRIRRRTEAPARFGCTQQSRERDMRMARMLVAVVMAAASIVSGCGNERSDGDQIRDTIRELGAAVADGDGRRACGRLTAKARQHVVRANPLVGAHSCAEVVDAADDVATEGQRRQARSIAVERVEVRGNRARAYLRDSPRLGPRRGAASGRGRWLLDELL